MHDVQKAAIWRAISLSGAGLVFIGVGAFLADFLSVGRVFAIFNDNYEILLLAIALGTLGLLVGLIGWFKYLNRRRRITLGWIVLVAPIVACLLGGAIGTTNVHGTFFLVVIPMIPVTLLGFVLVFVALASRNA